jgi:type IV secretory pathway VirB2 component (pilin)
LELASDSLVIAVANKSTAVGGGDPGDVYYAVYRYRADLEGRILGNVGEARCVAAIIFLAVRWLIGLARALQWLLLRQPSRPFCQLPSRLNACVSSVRCNC